MDFYYSASPWLEITVDPITNVLITGDDFDITTKLHVATQYTFKPSATTLSFAINGDLTRDPEHYTRSFTLAADEVPDISGTVNVQCAAAPGPALSGQVQRLTFTQGVFMKGVEVPLGGTTPCKIPSRTYTVTAAELTTPDQTVVASAQASPSSVTVVTDETTSVNVTYGLVTKYSAIDVIIEEISPLENDKLHVSVVDHTTGETLASSLSSNLETTSLRRLPPVGIAEVSIQSLTLNNTIYSFPINSVDLSGTLSQVRFSQPDVVTAPIDTTGFVQLPISMEADITVDAAISMRLSSEGCIYTETVQAQAGATLFVVPVAPGQYKVHAPSIIESGIVYFIDAPATLNVAADGSTTLRLVLQRGPNLNVRGFPSFLSFGGRADLTPGNQADFGAAHASSIFMYAGIDGAGDSGHYLSNDSATTRTIALARAVESQIGDGNPVLPVLISYTCNLSGGDTGRVLRDTEGLAHSFANLILSLDLANQAIDEQHPVPAGFIVNPDFIGTCQLENLSPDYSMPVRKPLQTALDHWRVGADIPDSINDTLRGYVLAVNWLVGTVGPAVTFGWQVSLWGVGSSTWVYETSEDPASIAKQIASYAMSLGIFDGDHRPYFLAVDHYEADDFTQRAYINGYCYGPREWDRFFDFCGALSKDLKAPVMPWQIPASRTPTVHDVVNDDFDGQHWGTGGSYILGDPAINSDYHNVNPKILGLNLSANPWRGTTAEDVFQHAEPFDLTNPAYLAKRFVGLGIFAVQLGGGSTTGIVESIGNPEPWVREKLAAYMKHPVYFDDAYR